MSSVVKKLTIKFQDGKCCITCEHVLLEFCELHLISTKKHKICRNYEPIFNETDMPILRYGDS